MKLKFAMLATVSTLAFANEGELTEQCATVMINTANGPVRINAEDFDESSMELADAPAGDPAPDAPDAPAGDPAPDAPATYAVSAEGTGAKRKIFVVDSTGAKVECDGIDSAGYADESSAWAAIMALTVPASA